MHTFHRNTNIKELEAFIAYCADNDAQVISVSQRTYNPKNMSATMFNVTYKAEKEIIY